MRKGDLDLGHLAELMANEKAASGKSAQTIDWYTGVIARYRDWLAEQELEPTLANFSLEQVRAYVVALQGTRARALHPTQPTESRPLSDASINSYVRALRGFSSWLADEGYTEAPVLARLKAPKMTQKTQPVLTEEEIATIVGALNPRTEDWREGSGDLPPAARYWHARCRTVRSAAAAAAFRGGVRGRAEQGAQRATGQDRDTRR